MQPRMLPRESAAFGSTFFVVLRAPQMARLYIWVKHTIQKWNPWGGYREANM